MIEFQDVTLYLSDRKVLDQLNFTVTDGELVLLAGGSGSGKSTILKLIMGLFRPNAGRILIDGEDITRLSERKLLKIRKNFGIVFQDGALFDSLTVAENVGFYLREGLAMEEEEVTRLVCAELSQLGLREFLNFYPAQLSGGMRKRVAIARAAIKHPRCLLYDEPTAGLDPMSSQRVVDLVHDLHRENKITTLIVTHEVHYFTDTVPRMLLLRDGQIDYDGVPIKDIHNWYGYDATPTTVDGCP